LFFNPRNLFLKSGKFLEDCPTPKEERTQIHMKKKKNKRQTSRMGGGIKKRGERDDYCCSTLGPPTDALVELNNKKKEKRKKRTAVMGWQLRRRKYDIRSIDIFQLLSVKTRPAAPKSQPSELYLFSSSLFPSAVYSQSFFNAIWAYFIFYHHHIVHTTKERGTVLGNSIPNRGSSSSRGDLVGR
jgi:hypothetical protein